LNDVVFAAAGLDARRRGGGPRQSLRFGDLRRRIFAATASRSFTEFLKARGKPEYSLAAAKCTNWVQ
jgi:hypothetical protein